MIKKNFPYIKYKVISLFLVFSLFSFGCSKLPKDNYTFLAALIKLSYKAPPTVASQYPNTTSGVPTSIQATAAISTATSAAVSSSISAASTVAANIIEPALKDAIANSKSLTQARVNFNSTTTCNGTTQTVTGTYTTVSQTCLSTTGITTVCPSQSNSSYTITPNITTKITFSCTYPASLTTDYTQTLNATYTISGSLQIAFSNAPIKYLDIDAFTKSATTSYKTSTLSGTISISNINQSNTGSTNAKYTSATGQTISTITNYSIYSDTITSSNLVVDSSPAAILNLAESGIINSSQTLVATTGSSTRCYSAVTYESGASASGSYNGLAVSTSYNLTTQDYIKMLSASGSSITLCQTQGGGGTTGGGSPPP